MLIIYVDLRQKRKAGEFNTGFSFYIFNQFVSLCKLLFINALYSMPALFFDV